MLSAVLPDYADYNIGLYYRLGVHRIDVCAGVALFTERHTPKWCALVRSAALIRVRPAFVPAQSLVRNAKRNKCPARSAAFILR